MLMRPVARSRNAHQPPGPTAALWVPLADAAAARCAVVAFA